MRTRSISTGLTVRVIGAAALLLAPVSTMAQVQSASQSKCIFKGNLGAAKVAKAQGGYHHRCVRRAGKDQLPPSIPYRRVLPA
jgi:hypothetical protein